MASIVSDEKTAVNLIGGPLISEESFFSSFWFQYFLCVFDNQHIYYDVFYHEPFCIYHIQFVELSKCVGYSVSEVFSLYLNFSAPFSSFFTSCIPIMHLLMCLIVCHIPIFFIIFSLYCLA